MNSHYKASIMPQLTSPAIQIALIAISTSLVCAVTMAFSIYVPQTRGFFNVGETMVFTTALLFGPLTGAFAGGVGSGLADVLLGFPYYAPATLLIKACEGGIVGLLDRVRPKSGSKFLWRAFTFGVGLLVGVLLGLIGAVYYSGEVELRLGIPPPGAPNVIFSISPMVWFVVGAVVAALVALAGFVFEPEFGWLVFTMLIGGVVMVSGYYLYQKFLLFPLFNIGDVIAEAEIPFNVGQMIVGLIIALPIVKIVERSLPQLKSWNHNYASNVVHDDVAFRQDF